MLIEPNLLYAAGGGAALLFALLVVLLIFRRRRKRGRQSVVEDLVIDLQSLDVPAPAARSPRLEFYGVPVRVAVLVIAPRGRSVLFPSSHALQRLVDRIVPGISKQLAQDQPVYRRWPVQMSFEGFGHAFFKNMIFPGQGGKGTPWCGVVGQISINPGHLLVGLACRAAEANEIGQIVVRHEGQWQDVLRIR